MFTVDHSERKEKRGKKQMTVFLEDSLFAGVTLSLLAYLLGVVLKKKFKCAIFNPLLISIVITIVVLVTAHVDYDVYNQGASYLSWFLTPATVCLAIPLYEQWTLLKRNIKAVLLGIIAGVLTSLGTVWVLAEIMGLSHKEYVTLLPKSITTAIGMGVSEELGGYVTITVAVIVVTGVLGNIFGELICKIFRITDPIARGLSIGSASHAIGTAKAMELGEIEGAMSSLAIAVAGIFTVAASSLFCNFL
ncbi:MAG: LrgB family protein [Eubacterium sp.]|nr:LrgB family protein [Eubacterium sp.]